jgi:tetratricopeptide (TPR) repeat protein
LLGSLGIAHYSLGQSERAIEYCQQALSLIGEIGERRDEEICLSTLASAYNALGQTEQCIEYYLQALTIISREFMDKESESSQLAALGSAYSSLGEDRQAKFVNTLICIKLISNRTHKQQTNKLN